MRYVITQMVGAGTEVDPLRAPFPTCAVVAGPFGANNLALIVVPDEDFKQDDGTDVVPGATQTLSAWLTARGVPAPRVAEAVARFGDVDITLAVAPAVLARWKARIDRRYRERQGGWPISVG